jgi:FAD/FMN-containing dehydrogenase
MTTVELDHTQTGRRPRLRRPGDPGYDEARQGWNLSVRQQPAAVMVAEGEADVQAAVRHAAEHGVGVGVMSTGHGITTPADGGVLVNTARMRRVHVDPTTRRATVHAGARWTDLIPEADAWGLTGLPGSAAHVGVVGYTLGGGFGWLGRAFGLSSHHVTRARVVTADGNVVVASETDNADLFWAIRGGTGNFGIVTELELGLIPLDEVYAGILFYPLDRAAEVLACFARWTPTMPSELTAAVTLRGFPPLPSVPEPLRGKRFVLIRGAYAGSPSTGKRLVDEVRAELGPAVIDTFGPMRPADLGAVGMDPLTPLAFEGHHELLRDLPPRLLASLVGIEGQDSPLVMLELRQLGGALTGSPDDLSPMAHSSAAYSLNAIGLTPDPSSQRVVRPHLDRVRAVVAPETTGDAYLNFLDAGPATPGRVDAAYSAVDRARLARIKCRYDPDNVFRFNRNVIHTEGVPS